MLTIDSCRPFEHQAPNPICNRPLAACRHSPSLKPPLTGMDKGWGRGGGCLGEMQFELQTPAEAKMPCP
jgi:hypothetical protein